MNSYYIDYAVTLYTTKVILAESEEEALRIGKKLAGNHEFWHDHMLPGFMEAEVLPENMGCPSTFDDGVYAVLMDEDTDEEEAKDEDERYMSADEMAAYIGEE